MTGERLCIVGLLVICILLTFKVIWMDKQLDDIHFVLDVHQASINKLAEMGEGK